MSWHNSLILLGICLYGLRLFGQGMLPHTSLTAMSAGSMAPVAKP